MHVGRHPVASTPDLEAAVGPVLDCWLLRDHPRPVAVALSGGGDSLALLLIAAEWARSAGRGLLVLTVDHRLRPESAGWTSACATTAARFGLPFRALPWIGDKPTSGLPAAARRARHLLLAQAARDAGARVILMGHTADDRLESRVMRASGSTTPEPREWSPSPVWPEGRGLFLLRPLLQVRRAEIRNWLTARGEAWIDDPTNEDTAYARPRARRAIADGAKTPPLAGQPCARSLAMACGSDQEGGLQIARRDLADGALDPVVRFVSAACLCAGGTTRPPGRDQIARLAARLRGGEAFVASLAGARIEADAMQVCFRREAGERARGGLAPLRIAAGETAVWDGRFEIAADRAIEVVARPGGTSPSADDPDVVLSVLALTYDRLLAACGAIEREPD